MFHRVAQSAFLIAGIALMAGGLQKMILTRSLASLTDQGSSVVQEAQISSSFRPGFLATAAETDNVAGLVVLGAIFMIIGFGMHAFTIRRKNGERVVPVHEGRHRESRKPNHWILWMNVRM